MTAAGNIETGYAHINGTALFYRAAGHGPALMMIHAGIADSRMWQPQMDAFADRFRVVAPDLRGFGNTAMPACCYANFTDVLALMDTLEIERAVLIGSSVGGATALNAALACPERVSALILAAPGLGGYTFRHTGTRRQWSAIHAAIASGNYYRAAELEIKLWVAGPYRRPSQVELEVRALVGVMLRQMYLTPLDRASEDPLVPPAIQRLGQISAPTLLINGALDLPDMLAIGDLIQAQVPGCTRVMIQDCAHLPNLEYADVFNMHVLAFLQSLGLAA